MKKTKKFMAFLVSVIMLSTLFANIPQFIKPVEASSSIFTNMQGVRWKPGLSGRDDLTTKTPYIPANAPFADAVALVDGVANYATIDLSPINKLIKAGMTQTEAEDWKALQITEVADFVAATKDYGITYFLHARISALPATEFIDDMSKEINELKRRGLDYKIAGVMIGEHDDTTSWNQAFQLAYDIADGINAKTSNWLNGKQLTMHGQSFGYDFVGVKDAAAAKNFFTTISNKTAGFAFTFKHFNGNFDGGQLRPTPADETKLMDPSTWKNFYKYDCGLDELKTLMNNHPGYPNYTNVIFVGDSTDSLYSITYNEDPAYKYHDVAINSIEQVFNGYGWTGFMFSLPFDNRDELAQYVLDEKRGMWGYVNGSFAEQVTLEAYIDYQEIMKTPEGGLKGFWRLDEPSGSTAYDMTGSNKDGTKYSGVNWGVGISKHGIWLNGSDGYVSLPYVLNPINNNFTAAAWVKLGTANASQTILAQDGTGGRAWLYRSESGKLSTYIGNAYLGSNTSIDAGAWYHVAVSNNNGTIKLYVNGVLENTAVRTVESASGGMLVGKHKNPSTTNEEWQGNIDNIRIYDRTLSDSEIISLYTNKQ